MSKIKRMNKMKRKLMIKRKALIKGEMRMIGIIKDQEQSHHMSFLGDIKKGVTTRSGVINFCQRYPFVSSMKPFKVEDALCDSNWVVAIQEELNNF
jgi:hypothetical protein